MKYWRDIRFLDVGQPSSEKIHGGICFPASRPGKLFALALRNIPDPPPLGWQKTMIHSVFFSTGWRWANWSNWSNWWCYHVTIPKEWFQDDFRGSADCCRQISQLLWWEGHCPSQLLAKCHQPCHPRWGTWRMFVFKGNSTEYCRCQMPI